MFVFVLFWDWSLQCSYPHAPAFPVVLGLQAHATKSCCCPLLFNEFYPSLRSLLVFRQLHGLLEQAWLTSGACSTFAPFLSLLSDLPAETAPEPGVLERMKGTSQSPDPRGSAGLGAALSVPFCRQGRRRERRLSVWLLHRRPFSGMLGWPTHSRLVANDQGVRPSSD